MTLIWHMYGGYDFKLPMSTDGNQSDSRSNSLGPVKKNVTINDVNSRQSPTFAHRFVDIILLCLLVQNVNT